MTKIIQPLNDKNRIWIQVFTKTKKQTNKNPMYFPVDHSMARRGHSCVLKSWCPEKIFLVQDEMNNALRASPQGLCLWSKCSATELHSSLLSAFSTLTLMLLQYSFLETSWCSMTLSLWGLTDGMKLIWESSCLLLRQTLHNLWRHKLSFFLLYFALES